MKRYLLQRQDQSDAGSFGGCGPAGEPPRWHSAELPPRGNTPGLSCIPAGIYRLERRLSPRFGRELFHFVDVPGRQDVLIHPLNFVGDKTKGLRADSEGCVGLGWSRGYLDGQLAILESGAAVADFMSDAGAGPIELEIRDPEGS